MDHAEPASRIAFEAHRVETQCLPQAETLCLLQATFFSWARGLSERQRALELRGHDMELEIVRGRARTCVERWSQHAMEMVIFLICNAWHRLACNNDPCSANASLKHFIDAHNLDRMQDHMRVLQEQIAASNQSLISYGQVVFGYEQLAAWHERSWRLRECFRSWWWMRSLTSHSSGGCQAADGASASRSETAFVEPVGPQHRKPLEVVDAHDRTSSPQHSIAGALDSTTNCKRHSSCVLSGGDIIESTMVCNAGRHRSQTQYDQVDHSNMRSFQERGREYMESSAADSIIHLGKCPWHGSGARERQRLENEQAERQRSLSPGRSRSSSLCVSAGEITLHSSPQRFLSHASMADLITDFSHPASVNSAQMFECGMITARSRALDGFDSGKLCSVDLLDFRRFLLRKFGSVDSAFTDADSARRVQRLTRQHFEDTLVRRWGYCSDIEAHMLFTAMTGKCDLALTRQAFRQVLNNSCRPASRPHAMKPVVVPRSQSACSGLQVPRSDSPPHIHVALVRKSAQNVRASSRETSQQDR
jgi:hypothetical protein